MAHTNVVEKGKVYQDPVTQEALRLTQPGHREIRMGDQRVVDVSLPVWSVQAASTEEEFLCSAEKS